MVKRNNSIRLKIDFEDTPLIDSTINTEQGFNDTIKAIKKKLYGR
jgi:hypothetical protein